MRKFRIGRRHVNPRIGSAAVGRSTWVAHLRTDIIPGLEYFAIDSFHLRPSQAYCCKTVNLAAIHFEWDSSRML